MSEEKKHINFTAADIEKYHKGLLSSKERHDLEKAALDDPFLADALEGYAIAGVNAAADLAELKKKLLEKTEGGKLVTMEKDRRSVFAWWKIAAMIVLVAGAGLLVYQFVFNKKTESIAQREPDKEQQPVSKDSGQANGPVVQKEVDKQAVTQSLKYNTTPKKDNADKVTVTKNAFGAGKSKTDTLVGSYEISANETNPTSVPTQPSVNNGYVNTIDNKKAFKKENIALDQTIKPIISEQKIKSIISEQKEAPEKRAFAKSQGGVSRDSVKDQLDRQQGAGMYKTNQAVGSNRRNDNYYRNNVFRGRVLDASNFGVPFANVTNINDSVGTYADSKGYFNIVSPDTVMNVEVRSLGFNSINTQLRNNVLNNQVVLQEDKNLNEVVLSNKKPNANRSRDDNMKVEEPEPADGWDNYDVYLANNIKMPENIRVKQSNAEVEVSFEVDKNGEPINIKVEKSLCKPCDQEAIRLIKDGPKWKRKAKKGRATVSVSFE